MTTYGARLERADRYRGIAGLAVTGMDLLEAGDISLAQPTGDDVRATLEKLREIYTDAYDWNAPALLTGPRGAGYQNRMRYKVRASINAWDLMRLYPDARPEIEGDEFRYSYDENTDLERSSPEDEH